MVLTSQVIGMLFVSLFVFEKKLLLITFKTYIVICACDWRFVFFKYLEKVHKEIECTGLCIYLYYRSDYV